MAGNKKRTITKSEYDKNRSAGNRASKNFRTEAKQAKGLKQSEGWKWITLNPLPKVAPPLRNRTFALSRSRQIERREPRARIK